jgi:hypothetical protein
VDDEEVDDEEVDDEEVDDEEVDDDTAVGELKEEEDVVVVGVAIGLVGVTWLVLSVAVVVVEESWVSTEDEIEVVTTLGEV